MQSTDSQFILVLNTQGHCVAVTMDYRRNTGTQPPSVAAKPKKKIPLTRPPIHSDVPDSGSVSALKSRLFGEAGAVGSSATMPRPSRAFTTTALPTPESDEEEYDDISNIVPAHIRRAPSFNNAKMKSTTITPSPSLPKLNSEADFSKPHPAISPPPPQRALHSVHPPISGPPKSPGPRHVPPRSPHQASDPVPLSDFVRNYKLPQKVRVYAGFNEGREKSRLNEGEQLYLHYQKHSQAVLISIGQTAQMMVPVNSGVEFGVIYNPEGDYNKAYQGYQFETVGQLLASPVPPSVMCVKRPWSGGSQESTINTNDVLLIKEIVQRSYGPTYLSCLNVKTGEQKMLPETCTGFFTTYPYEACLHLHQIVEHLKLPLECLALYSKPNSDDIRSRLPRNVMKLERTIQEKTVVTSKPSSVTTSSLFSIATKISMEVQQIQLSADEAMQLSEMTKNLYQKYNPAKVCPVNPPPGHGGEGLDVLCEVVNEHNPGVGVELIRPPCVPASLQWNQGMDIELEEDDDLVENEYDIPDVAIASYRAKMNHPKEKPSLPSSDPPSTPKPVPNKLPNDTSHYDVPRSNKPQLTGATNAAATSIINQLSKKSAGNSETEVDLLKKEVTSLRETVKSVQTSCNRLQDQLGVWCEVV